MAQKTKWERIQIHGYSKGFCVQCKQDRELVIGEVTGIKMRIKHCGDCFHERFGYRVLKKTHEVKI